MCECMFQFGSSIWSGIVKRHKISFHLLNSFEKLKIVLKSKTLNLIGKKMLVLKSFFDEIISFLSLSIISFLSFTIQSVIYILICYAI